MENKTQKKMKKPKEEGDNIEPKEFRSALLNVLDDAEKSKKAAEEEKERTTSIINNLTDGLIILDENEKIIAVNPMVETIFSIKAGEIMQKSIRELKGNPLFSPALDLILDENGIKEIKSAELSPREKVTVELTSVPTKMGNSKEDGHLLIFHDISRQKLVESLKTEFVTLAAHQLRTPLSGIKWNLKMLINGDFGQLTPEQKELMVRNYQNNERMIKLVNDLLDATKLEEGRYLYYKTEENIIDIAKDVIASLTDKIKQKNVQLIFSKPKTEIPKLKIDKEKIGICIQNLLVNAITYNRPGGKVTISIEYDKSKKEVIVSVSDTGMGISKEQQKRIFGKFFRSTEAMKVETVGSGLGLYMTKNILDAHKGRIWFESEENVGSTFYFALSLEG